MAKREQAGERHPGTDFLWFVYSQAAAMLGAFSLLVFLSHFFDFGLKGIIADAMAVWNGSVRPMIGRPLQWIVDLLPASLRFHLTDLQKDYCAVGLVAVFSAARIAIRDRLFLGRTPIWHGAWIAEIVSHLWGLIWLFFFWPVALAYLLVTLPFAIFVADDRQHLWRSVARAAVFLAPLAYLGALFAANALLS